jgi:hypothetical protein
MSFGLLVPMAEGGVLLRQFKLPGEFRCPHWSPNKTALQYVLTQDWSQQHMGTAAFRSTASAINQIHLGTDFRLQLVDVRHNYAYGPTVRDGTYVSRH